jgi:hypothetical protein
MPGKRRRDEPDERDCLLEKPTGRRGFLRAARLVAGGALLHFSLLGAAPSRAAADTCPPCTPPGPNDTCTTAPEGNDPDHCGAPPDEDLCDPQKPLDPDQCWPRPDTDVCDPQTVPHDTDQCGQRHDRDECDPEAIPGDADECGSKYDTDVCNCEEDAGAQDLCGAKDDEDECICPDDTKEQVDACCGCPAEPDGDVCTAEEREGDVCRTSTDPPGQPEIGDNCFDPAGGQDDDRCECYEDETTADLCEPEGGDDPGAEVDFCACSSNDPDGVADQCNCSTEGPTQCWNDEYPTGQDNCSLSYSGGYNCDLCECTPGKGETGGNMGADWCEAYVCEKSTPDDQDTCLCKTEPNGGQGADLCLCKGGENESQTKDTCQCDAQQDPHNEADWCPADPGTDECAHPASGYESDRCRCPKDAWGAAGHDWCDNPIEGGPSAGGDVCWHYRTEYPGDPTPTDECSCSVYNGDETPDICYTHEHDPIADFCACPNENASDVVVVEPEPAPPENP